jgi:uncharacterized protein YodC (DUF2158 family)
MTLISGPPLFRRTMALIGGAFCMSFNVGELVKLKSGGPNMTVTSIGKSADRPDIFVCQWIDKDHRAQTGSYPAEALIKPAEKRISRTPPVISGPRRGGGGGTGWMR